MDWAVSGIQVGGDSGLQGVPLTGLQLSCYQGPDRARIGGATGQEFLDPDGTNSGDADPNDTANWEDDATVYQETAYVDPPAYSWISAYRAQSPGAFIHGSSVGAYIVFSPFTIPQLDGPWFGSADVGAARGNATIAELAMTIKSVTMALYGEQNEAGNRTPTGLIGGQSYFWGETVVETPANSGILTLGLCGLYKVAGTTTLEARMLTQAGAGGTVEAGTTVGMDLTGFCQAYIGAGAARAFACIASNGDIPPYDAAVLNSAAGMKQLLKSAMLGSIEYVQDAAKNWWPIGTPTYWTRQWRSLAPSGGWLNLASVPALDSRARVQGEFVPSMV